MTALLALGLFGVLIAGMLIGWAVGSIATVLELDGTLPRWRGEL